MIQPDMGVVVCVQNPSGKLTNNDGATELSIWAFATSWGVYRDVLTIEGDGQLPPVSFQLEIICTSNPISFPAFCKPVLRLCSIHYQDSMQSYPVRVKNNSSSDILVHWSIHNILDYRVSRKTHPFKLDLWDASEDPNDWGLTLNPFYGNVYLNTFSVDEPYFRLRSWTERTLTLNVNPRDVEFDADNAETPPLSLNAVLVGCVFPDPDFEPKHPDWDQSKMAAVETAHLLVKINVDKPKLVLLHDEDESMLQFFVRGEDLWNSSTYKQTRQFMWQNQSTVSTNVSIETEEPFKIELRQNGVKLNSLDRRIKLISGETLEMVLTLKITDGIGEIENLLEDIPVSPPSTLAEELSGPRLSRERKEVGKIAVYLDGHLDQVPSISKLCLSNPFQKKRMYSVSTLLKGLLQAGRFPLQ
ncbi:uncharacterized protein LOC120353699 isoform X2 [Nilaparvata lugens]|uniref:uncharacterized protein LOC120353699 isoform X2 n=1 Tax=Nilaparvata lugens TaxID=108931 RepID=UPI00193CEDAF|nr:uncharacterized protein LOC120353699 isoform X2 [Nilaparvata lugens]